MVKAAVKGIVDFEKAELLDVHWWNQLWLKIGGMVREDEQKLVTAQLTFHSALLGNSALTEESFKSNQEQARSSFMRLLGLVKPWEETDEEKLKRDEAKQLKAAWEANFGDMDDPETQKNIEETLAVMQQQVEEAQNYVDEEALVQERMMKFWDEKRNEDRRQRAIKRRR